MTSIIIPSSSGMTSIKLETRKGTSILNSQSHQFSRFELAQQENLDNEWRGVLFRTPPNPIYNCHGLTFASKRTSIHETASLRTILNDDGYTEIQRDNILPGDIALYLTDTGDIEHSGIVITEPDQQFGVPKVVSKWGRYKEAIHWIHACPYESSNVKYYRVTKWD